MSPSRTPVRPRPSQVLPIPREQAPWAPPAVKGVVAGSRARNRRRRVRAVVAVVVLLVLGAVLVTSTSVPTTDTPSPVTDVATEDAVVSVLRVYDAEVRLTQATGAGTEVFAIPGPLGRAQAIEAVATELQALLTELRAEEVAPGTPGEVYLAHPDHDALRTLATEVADHARRLGFLGEVHDTLYGGAGVVSLPQARQRLEGEFLTDPDHPAMAAWGGALAAAIDGQPDVAASTRLQASAAQEWRVVAQRIGPAAGSDLAAFLNGIDPGVLAALDGHPLAGPALRRLQGTG